jgi:NAD(P)-dependent dehydrogenase (short-subunit alcohol dehydrogenase family)
MSPRISTVLLDVTDRTHLAALDNSLPDQLDAVVNNAGIFMAAPIEAATARDEIRQQFEVNLIGALAVTQAVLPRLRRSPGRIVFISSVNGSLSFPLFGAYSASKFALEAAADALRMELKPWDIDVVVVRPGETDTDIWRTIEARLEDTHSSMTSEHRALYATHMAGLNRMIPIGKKLVGPPERVAAVVEKALTVRRPRAHYTVGISNKLQLVALHKLPVTVRDRLLRTMFRQPGPHRQALR